MNEQQTAAILFALHGVPGSQKDSTLNEQLRYFGLTDEEQHAAKSRLLDQFQNGIGRLNKNQLANLMELSAAGATAAASIRNKLNFYEVAPHFQENINEFLRQYAAGSVAVESDELDAEFRGVQVASRDNFNTIINQGWTGDWDLNPDNIHVRRVQVASMNEEGLFPRGYYLNADIRDIQPIPYEGKTRYRIFIANPVIINTGNRNVKFIAQPVRYK
ncbi:hypothetical protein [Hymenobacter metallilatus]|uniref:Uncharacterized protein n=1 Tax=Hymenobacter metallilatus TaxID=2493666 RepID=A0A428J055_9BACT|nr:hypothetical protein [Hymenobacter metallilatus]RSK24983.1 hypothetical protein EI290_18340 [Hymenobacter metallilatus]